MIIRPKLIKYVSLNNIATNVNIYLLTIGIIWGLFANFSYAISINYGDEFGAIAKVFGFVFGSLMFFLWDKKACLLAIRKPFTVLILFSSFIYLISSFIYSESYSDVVREISFYISIIIIYGVFNSKKSGSVSILLGFIFSSLVFIGFSLFSSQTNAMSSAYDSSRYLLTYGNANIIGWCTVVILLITISELFSSKYNKLNNLKKIILICIIVFSFSVIFICRSRTSFIALLSAVFILFVKYINLKKLYCLILLSCITMILSAYLYNFNIIDYILNTFEIVSGQRSEHLYTLTGRTVIWKYAINDLMPMNPFIGIGAYSHEMLLKNCQSNSFLNGYLKIIVERGIIGGSPLFYILAKVAYNCFKEIGYTENQKLVNIYSVLCIALFIEAIGEDGFFGFGITPALIVNYAMIVMYNRNRALPRTTKL